MDAARLHNQRGVFSAYREDLERQEWAQDLPFVIPCPQNMTELEKLFKDRTVEERMLVRVFVGVCMS